MVWKDLPYWSKGGIIGMIIVILIILISLFIPVRCIGLSQDGTACHSPQGFDAILYNIDSLANISLLYLVLVIVIVSCFVGWIYGKIKERKFAKL